jgi:hypothetical protein
MFLGINNGTKFIIAVLILTAIFLVFHSNKLKILPAEDIIVEDVFVFPEFSVVDYFGNTIDRIEFKENYVFVQFLDPKSYDHIHLLKNVCKEHGDDDLCILVFLKESEGYFFQQFMDELRFAMGNFILITDEYIEYKVLFEVPECCEIFMIFDEKGKQLMNESATFNSFRLVQNRLNRSLKSVDFSIAQFLPENTNIRNLDWMSQISSIQESRNENYCLISMFTDICTGCLSGNIIERMKKSYLKKRDFIYHLTIVPQYFAKNDIDNLKSQLNLHFDIIIANEQLDMQWNKLKEDYGHSNLNILVFLLDGKGTILRTMEENSTCIEDFFSFVNKL